MRGDDPTAWCYLAFWTFVIITQSFRLHFHHFQLYSGKLSVKKNQSILNCSHLFTYLNAKSTLSPKKGSLTLVRWYCLLKIIYPTTDNLYWFTRYATCSNSFFRHFYSGYISMKRSYLYHLSYLDYKRCYTDIIICFRESWFSFFIVCGTARWDEYQTEDVHRANCEFSRH